MAKRYEPDLIKIYIRVCQNGYVITEVRDNPEAPPDFEGLTNTTIPKKLVTRFVEGCPEEVGNRVMHLTRLMMERLNGQDD